MSGLLYAVFVVAILFIIRWYTQNERLGPDSDGSKGLLAMRSTQSPSTGATAPNRSPNGMERGR